MAVVSTGKICLNLGSGQRPFKPPFINVDVQERWHPDVLANMDNLSMYQDNSVDIAVMHHSAEHMTLDGSMTAFREAHRVLKPGGSLLVFVPDLDALVRKWIHGLIDTYTLCVNLHGAYMGQEEDIHRWSYTKDTLRKHLKGSCKWGWVFPYDWRTIEGADIARDWWVLGVEAVK